MVLALMGLMALLATGWMTRPLWRAQLASRQRRRAANVAAYRQRLLELDTDAAAGLVDADTASALRAELDERLLLDAEPDAIESGALPTARAWLGSLALIVLVIGLALAGYVHSGSWKAQQQIVTAPPSGEGTPESIEAMVTQLATRLAQKPDDAEGWAMLGRAYFVLTRYEDSAQAYGRANDLTDHQEPDLLVNQGEALGLARERDLSGTPRELFESALKIQPTHGKALWYSALAAEQAGDRALAHARWQALSQQELPEQLRTALQERLAATADLSSAGSVPKTAPSAPTEAVVLDVALRLSPDLAGKVGPQDSLFVFAKAAAGPPMPLAVYRGTASELPRAVRLDDSMAMSPTIKLSQFDRWVVTARVSRSGQPLASSGDVQGSLTVAREDLGKTALVLVLDQVVP